MGLTRIAISRPLAILMLILSLVIMGTVAFGLLKVDRMPAMSIPFVSVSTSYSGASPQDVEDLIVKPIEQAVAGISGIDTLESDSMEGRGMVRIQFLEGVDANAAAIDVERKVSAIRGRLPDDAGTPTVSKADPNSQSIMNISLIGDVPLDQLYSLASDIVQPKLQSVLGVADVSIGGGLTREVRVIVDYTKLEAYGVTVTDISNAINRENVNSPGGSVKQGQFTYSIRTQSAFQSADELADLIVSNTTNGPILLRDVAKVNESTKDRTSYQRFNGQESVGISVTKTSEANSLQVAEDLRGALKSLEVSLPKGAKLVISNDTSRYTKNALEAIEKDLAIAVVLCGAVLLLFLHAWRNTLIVILAIPTSLITTFLVMYATGMSLNTISMMALALTIGILVDDSIVVLENIHRHIARGEPKREAALKGRSEIGLAAMAITMVDVVVYLPVAFMSGMTGKMFKEYGLTIASATLISLFISFTLTPMLASRWMKDVNDKDDEGGFHPLAWFPGWWERNYERLANGYGRVLRLGLRARPLVLLIGISAFVGALSLIPLKVLTVEYAPAEDDNQLNVNLSLSAGMSLERADAITRQIEQGILTIPEVQNVFTTVRASSSGGGFGGSGPSMSVQLVDKKDRQRTIWDIQNQIRRLGTGIPDVSLRSSISSSLGMGGGGNSSLRIDLKGDSLNQLMAMAKDVDQLARQIPGITDIRVPDPQGSPEIRAVVDRKKAADLGVSSTTVGSALRVMISGSAVSALRPPDRDQMDITLVASDADRLDLNRLLDMPIAYSSTVGVVRLGQVASLTKSSSPTSISHSSRQRVITVQASVDGRALSDVADDLRKAVLQMDKPIGYSVSVTGSIRMMDQTMDALKSALSLSVLLIYMLLVALYESWLQPFTIMLALPLALIGAFGGLVLTGNTLNLYSMIGLIMLMGLVAKNGILLVDYTNTLRSRGESRTEAIIESGRARLRPILMTTSTIVCSMIPLALKMESGAEARAPMAVVVIGGVISSTMLTLFVVPSMYTYMDDLNQRLGRLGKPSFLRSWRKRRQMAN